jgi:mannose-6-phosphate isomerase-like protein (cupin superfamily)
MKRIFKILIIMVALSIYNVKASSASITASKTTAYVGDKVTITVKINAGTWNLKLSGSLNDTIVGYDMDGNKETTKNYTLDTTSTGIYTISLTGDITDYVTEETKNINEYIKVEVKKKEAQTQMQTQTTTQASTTKETEETKKEEVKESKITNFKIVGYDIDFSEEVTNYTVSIDQNVSELYILVEGENISVINDKLVDIKDKDSISVEVKGIDKEDIYTININRIKNEVKTEIKYEENKTDKKLIVMNCLLLVILVFLIFKKKKVIKY